MVVARSTVFRGRTSGGTGGREGIGVGTSTNGVICRHEYYRVAIEQLDAAGLGREGIVCTM